MTKRLNFEVLIHTKMRWKDSVISLSSPRSPRQVSPPLGLSLLAFDPDHSVSSVHEVSRLSLRLHAGQTVSSSTFSAKVKTTSSLPLLSHSRF